MQAGLGLSIMTMRCRLSNNEKNRATLIIVPSETSSENQRAAKPSSSKKRPSCRLSVIRHESTEDSTTSLSHVVSILKSTSEGAHDLRRRQGVRHVAPNRRAQMAPPVDGLDAG